MQAQIDANWTKIESEISVAAQRLYWRTKLTRGDRLPTRELVNIAQQAIENFRDAGHELPRTEMSAFVEAASAWLERNRGKIWRIAAEEESG